MFAVVVDYNLCFLGWMSEDEEGMRKIENVAE